MADKSDSKGVSKGKTSPKKANEGMGKKKVHSPTKLTASAAREDLSIKNLESDTKVVPDTVPPAESSLKEKNVDVGEQSGDAEGELEGAAGESWSGWFTNTINSAKERSTEMLQYLKQDLSEFTDTVSEAGRDLKDKLKIEESAKQAANVVGEKVNVVLEQMSSIFGVGPDDDDEPVIVGNSGRLVVDRIQAKIYSLASDESVFLEDPVDWEYYNLWIAGFDLESKSDEIVVLLANNPHLQLHYSQFVPTKVSHIVFWHRFYYRVQKIFDEEAKQQAKELQEKNQQSSSNKNSDASGDASPIGDIGASGDQSMVEISEEDQKRLLAEYEEELKKDESGKHSRRSSGTQLSSSSSGSFAFVTRDPDTNELKVD